MRSLPMHLRGLERLIPIAGRDYDVLLAADAMACAEVPGDSLAWLFFTSGTTGRPKGAMLSHANLMAASYAYLAEVDPVKQNDVTLLSAPMSHGAGIYIMPHVLGRGNLRDPGIGRFRALGKSLGSPVIGATPRCSPRRPW